MSAANGRNLDALVHDLMSVACDTLAHDLDIMDGTEDCEIANKRSLEKDFLKVLRKHRITNQLLDGRSTP